MTAKERLQEYVRAITPSILCSMYEAEAIARTHLNSSIRSMEFFVADAIDRAIELFKETELENLPNV